VSVKRTYERPSGDDGIRVLVDRLWPRGLSKTQLAIDFWLKDAAPSEALRRWYGHNPDRWKLFVAKYRGELAQHAGLLNLLDDLRRRAGVTLLFSARDTAQNNAVVLRQVLEEWPRRGKRTTRSKSPRAGRASTGVKHLHERSDGPVSAIAASNTDRGDGK
jgi:uncharacterized protein YeaO (DUF488 family)